MRASCHNCTSSCGGTLVAVDGERIEDACRALLEAIGEDPGRQGLRDTPRRWAAMWREFVDYDAGKLDTAFESLKADQMVVVSGMRVWSFCEHHLLPFWCDVACGYTTDAKIIGLSKFARISHRHAHRLQVQERLVEEIADDIATLTGSENVGVIARGVHTCMVMRGVRTEGVMTSSAMRGAFRHNAAMREEFLNLARGA